MEDRTTIVDDIFRHKGHLSFSSRSQGDLPAEASAPSPKDVFGQASEDTGRRNTFFSVPGSAPTPAPLAPAAVAPGTASDGSGGALEADDDTECASDAWRSMSMETRDGSDDAQAGYAPNGGGAARAGGRAAASRVAIFASPAHTTSPSGLSVIRERPELFGATASSVEQEEGATADDIARQTSPREAANFSDNDEKQQTRDVLPAAGFFAVYDGHDGDVVAEALHQRLHKLVAKQVCEHDIMIPPWGLV